MRTRCYPNKIWKLIMSIVISQLLLGCTNKASFSDQELTWLVYDAFDKLVFKNTVGDLDTITIIEKKVGHTSYNPGESHGYYNPAIGELTYSSTFFARKGKVQKLIEMLKETPTKFVLTLTLHNTHFFLSADKFEKCNERIIVNNISYSDIIIISKNPNEIIPDDIDQPKLLYWSKSKGLIMFENYNQETWTLISTTDNL